MAADPHMDALKNRVRAYTEGILIMVSPVLVAITLKKVNLKGEGNEPVRRSISPLAAASLLMSLIAFVFINTASMLKDHFPERVPEFPEPVFRLSKLLVHATAILQMVLAYMIVLLLTMRFIAFVVPLLGFVGVLLFLLIKSSVARDGGLEQERAAYGGCEEKLEQSLDLSAAVTSLLFLALEGLALEGSQVSVGHGLDGRLLPPLGLTFAVCLVSMAGMLLGVVPPPMIREGQRRHGGVTKCFNAMCLGLTVLFTFVVLTFIPVVHYEVAVLMVALPWIIIGLVYVLYLCDEGGSQEAVAAQPASLELTKATFVGFLAVSIPSITGGGSLDIYKHATILSTAAAVVSGLVWRLLTHYAPKKAAVRAANVASLVTYLFAVAAVILFAILAAQALETDDA
ncbi:hypothetical protein ACP70R_023462 [Stipagrostis hirtigluma subsp. patula]